MFKLSFDRILALLLIFIPISIALDLLHADPIIIFVSAALAIVPIAGFMGKATEELSKQVGAGIGGLLNATFGNATELIIAFFAIQAGLFEVVKASITGAIIGNVLLITVDQSALPAHQKHGDIIPAPAGGCPQPTAAPAKNTQPKANQAPKQNNQPSQNNQKKVTKPAQPKANPPAAPQNNGKQNKPEENGKPDKQDNPGKGGGKK
jgi:putative effector of murein hydrolase LrgA (UPF0299 family)